MRQEIAITVDTVIFKDFRSSAKILLIQRKNAPFKNKWALPGGFLEETESLIEGAKRELFEETGLELDDLKQLKTYGNLNRDPRGRTISIAFIGELRKEVQIKAGDDAKEADWFRVDELPKLAFDHAQIIEDAKEHLRNNNY
ncbi:8-oxo-dGTP diphosphatase [Gillisia sp. Hel_I_86]|uniref:NUDIX domain-containing protein n=1 Tax=Gillisia sp. Hel_I_86 TaxID=1249981 RepID=UPI00119B4040|nr:NUDIX hydrolase [Gillisia sp. Hel_I_86]TVZ28479.1 8-oxo-dGTP diphosphatase [Gillisia sp. Hel_I_86]